MNQFMDFFMGSIFINSLNNLQTGIYLLDILLFILFIFLNTVLKEQSVLNFLKDQFNNTFYKSKEKRKITFSFKRGEQSNRCKSLFHYLTKINTHSSNINFLVEDTFKKFDWKADQNIEKSNLYRVEQSEYFNFTDKIFGKVFSEEKESTQYNGKTVYKQLYYLVLYSDEEPLENIIKFIEKCKSLYEKHLKDMLLAEQYLITVENGNTIEEESKNSLKIKKEIWNSNVNFNSRFFPNKDDIISSIEHFLKNADWYEKKGLNHTLGILLSGKPGCGKTSFIKALMNYTKRHCIEIKLNDNFDFSLLKDIIYNDEISNEIVIPQEKRIIVFEDIDAMGNVVKDREIKLKENLDAENKFKDEMIKLLSDPNSESEKKDVITLKNKINKLENNNLSYLLNILDGINETPGRIIIMTTNKPELLDPALKRPGRIDINLNFENSNVTQLKEILDHYWESDDNSINIENNRILNLHKFDSCDKVFSPAEIIDLCRKSKTLQETLNLLDVLTIKN